MNLCCADGFWLKQGKSPNLLDERGYFPNGFEVAWLATGKSPFSTWYFAMSDFLFKRNPLFDSASFGMA